MIHEELIYYWGLIMRDIWVTELFAFETMFLCWFQSQAYPLPKNNQIITNVPAYTNRS